MSRSVVMLCALFCVVAASVLTGCRGGEQTQASASRDDRLKASPSVGGRGCTPGVHALRVGEERKALMRVTAGSAAGRRALILVLHGAGGSSKDGLYAFRGGWAARGVVLVAPASERNTWSIVAGKDTDRDTVQRALDRALSRCRIDRRRIAVGGFSDGATYALTLGLDNGNLFSAVMALSPGGVLAQDPVGKPRVFVAHGTLDQVLPFTRTRDELVPGLRAVGYPVTFRTFRGGHKAPEAISKAAVRWFLGG